MPPLRTAQYNSKWLNEPHFISAYDIGLFTFFFLRENAVEHDCGKTVYSRVARVCKNDIGGRFLLEDTWTTFMKARLNCSRSGEIPFYYNELQSTFYLPEQDLIYGIFTTNVNSIAASAVCAFNLSAITQAFNGPFRSQENPRSTWLPTPNPKPIHNFQLPGPNEGLTERSLQDAQRLYLMNDVVQPESVDPLVMQDDVRFSNLVVDIVQGMDTLYHVMYISTEYGTILKALATPNKNLQGCYLEEMELHPQGVREPILSLQILHSDRSLFVGLNNRVLKIPLERCSIYKTETLCLEARDPYCGWDFRQHRCTTLEDSSNMSQWKQNITVCPLRNQTTNGGFGPWAPWQPCNNDDSMDGVSSCLCRSRSCDSPAPRCGGRNCEGPTIEVSNCSRFCNEGVSCPQPIFWSPWGSWTKCSTECGGGVHSRVRTCENGNSCPGCALEYKACNLEACPEVKRNTPWTPWMPVNVTQGGARQEQRMRYMCRAHLSDPHELQIGRRKVETRFCPNDGTAACETDTLVEELLKTPVVRVGGPGWSSWETWSSCSQSCAKGYRTRRRSCTGPEGKSAPIACQARLWSTRTVTCPGEYQDCNVQACPVKGAWSCWSSWSQCSVGCGGGHYQRTRSCNSPVPANGGDICIGLHTEEALCNTHTCDGGCVARSEQMVETKRPVSEHQTDRKGGWMAWSLWSACDDSGLQMRSRVCGAQGNTPCVGNNTQRRDCNEIPVILPASGFDKDQHCGAFTSIHLIATGVSCFLGAGLLSFLIYVYCQRFHKPSQESAVIHPTTPNHLNYKGNTTPKNEKYTPMEFKTLNKNNLLPDERSNFYPTPLQQTNVYTTTLIYYPTALSKYRLPAELLALAVQDLQPQQQQLRHAPRPALRTPPPRHRPPTTQRHGSWEECEKRFGVVAFIWVIRDGQRCSEEPQPSIDHSCVIRPADVYSVLTERADGLFVFDVCCAASRETAARQTCLCSRTTRQDGQIKRRLKLQPGNALIVCEDRDFLASAVTALHLPRPPWRPETLRSPRISLQDLHQSAVPAAPGCESTAEEDSENQLRLFVALLTVRVLTKYHACRPVRVLTSFCPDVPEAPAGVCKASAKNTKRVVLQQKDPAVDALIVQSLQAHVKQLAARRTDKDTSRSTWRDVLHVGAFAGHCKSPQEPAEASDSFLASPSASAEDGVGGGVDMLLPSGPRPPALELRSLGQAEPGSAAVSHGDKDVQVEAVVRLPEEEDEDEAEEAGARQTPVQPRQLCRNEETQEETCCSINHRRGALAVCNNAESGGQMGSSRLH
ncbi:hypothetical protein L3Q82_004310 [Scortum barcoo]|uniref:Uncharacterized protein n=1 Tax=Scortum barcoo TaxID=214431 RepID=A0ACB8VJ68_9TELE|nr:hypothetical protein L3Q82_004310 [Scortum barcoo]